MAFSQYFTGKFNHRMFKLRKWLQLLLMAGFIPVVLMAFIAEQRFRRNHPPVPGTSAPAMPSARDSSLLPVDSLHISR